MRQHFTAVRAAAQICEAVVQGDEVASQEINFRPGPVKAGDYAFSIGTAGSCTLLLQTLLPPLPTATGRVRFASVEGRTTRARPRWTSCNASFSRSLKAWAFAGVESMTNQFHADPRRWRDPHRDRTSPAARAARPGEPGISCKRICRSLLGRSYGRCPGPFQSADRECEGIHRALDELAAFSASEAAVSDHLVAGKVVNCPALANGSSSWVRNSSP
jgi:hypothetical protein